MTPDEHRMLKLGNIYIPMITVGSVIAAAFIMAWQLSSERAKIYNEIDGVKGQIQTLTQTVDRFVRVFDERLNKGTDDRYTRQDFIIDCLQHQVLNPSWRCAYGRNVTNIVRTEVSQR